MKEDQKQTNQTQQPVESRTDVSSNPGEGAVVQGSAWKRLMAKKWVFPALYLAAAAIILSLMWAYQNSTTDVLSEEEVGLSTGEEVSDPSTLFPDALPVTVNADEEIDWPVFEPQTVQVVRPFYDENSDNVTKQAAMIELENGYIPSMGITLARDDQASFEVLAALSGTVVLADELPLVGHVVEIEHADGLRTVYQGLSGVEVEEGQIVEQGEFIAHAGRNELNQADGVHVHFEVYEDEQAVNPASLLPIVE